MSDAPKSPPAAAGGSAGQGSENLDDLLAGLGIAGPIAPDVRCCLDWTEQRHHLAGPLGKALAHTLVARGWVVPGRVPRAAELTPAGRAGLRRALGVEVPDDRS